MTETNSNENPNFRSGSLRDLVYKEYFVLNNTNPAEIATKINIPVHKVIYTIAWLKNKYLAQESVANISTNPTTGAATLDQTILIKVYEQRGKVMLYIKTSEDFEKWLKDKKEIRDTSQLFGKILDGKFYYLKIIENYDDDINCPIIRNGKINFAVLRIPGISNGIEFELDGLLTEEQLESAVKKLVEAFKKFYTKHIIAKKINIEAEVLAAK
jgi:hypothetical protein